MFVKTEPQISQNRAGLETLVDSSPRRKPQTLQDWSLLELRRVQAGHIHVLSKRTQVINNRIQIQDRLNQGFQQIIK